MVFKVAITGLASSLKLRGRSITNFHKLVEGGFVVVVVFLRDFITSESLTISKKFN